MIGTSIGPYEVSDKLGAGGMGEVYRARDKQLDRDVALKVLPESFAADPDRLQRFEREARTLASLNHANIAQVYGLEKADSIVIVMELVEGVDLAERLVHGPLDVDETLSVARQVAAALEAAHAADVVHRDLKPANVKLRDDGTVKVLDFGLAKPGAARAASSATTDAPTSVADSPTMLNPTLTGAGVILGSAAYMSPEQARGKPVDHRADVWAFGCLLFEMLTAQRAFDGEDASMTLASVLKRDVDFSALPEDTPAELRRMIERCLQTDPGQRYQAIGDARIDIEGWLADGFAARSTDVTGGVASGAGWQRAALLAALAAIVAAAAGYGAGLLTAPAPPEPPVTRLSMTREAHADVAVSPDGNLLALADAEGLWLRPRDREELRLVAEAGADVDGPFFSPDGRWIGYFAAAQLRKVPVDGGASLPVNTVPNPFRFCGNADWGAGDTIVFSCSDSGGLWTVPAAGGEPRRLTERGTDEGIHADPAFLPDGAAVLFAIEDRSDRERGGDFELAAVSTIDPQAGVRRLGVQGMGPRYLPGGDLLFARGEALWAVPFDPADLTVRGEPFPVIEGATAPSRFGTGLYAVSGGTLAYWSGRFLRDPPSYPLVLDRSGQTVAALTEQLTAQRSRFSPDGRRLLLDIGSDDGVDPSVRIVDLARGTVNGVGTGYALGWSRDGGDVTYAFGNTEGRTDVYRRPWDLSADATRVATVDNFINGFSWAPGGDAFVFSMTRGDRTSGISSDIGRWSAADGIEWLLDSGDQEGAPALSPDGGWLAYHYAESGQRQVMQVFVRPFPGPGGRTQVSIDGGRMPRWSGDGRTIFFWHDDAVWEVPFDPAASEPLGQPTRLFTHPASSPRWAHFDAARDGTRFVVHVQQELLQEPPRLHVIYHWDRELERLMAGGR